jgi:protein-S-isoprenylcysteine O-methyltransferase Ste14
MAAQPPPEELREQPLGDLVKQLADQTSTLVRREIDLAKAETTQHAREAGKGAGLMGAGAVVGLLGAGTLVAFVVLALNHVIPDWLAALIVGVVLVALAAALVAAGRKRMRRATPAAPQTVETVKEDVQWAKTRTRSAQR